MRRDDRADGEAEAEAERDVDEDAGEREDGGEDAALLQLRADRRTDDLRSRRRSWSRLARAGPAIGPRPALVSAGDHRVGRGAERPRRTRRPPSARGSGPACADGVAVLLHDRVGAAGTGHRAARIWSTDSAAARTSR